MTLLNVDADIFVSGPTTSDNQVFDINSLSTNLQYALSRYLSSLTKSIVLAGIDVISHSVVGNQLVVDVSSGSVFINGYVIFIQKSHQLSLNIDPSWDLLNGTFVIAIQYTNQILTLNLFYYNQSTNTPTISDIIADENIIITNCLKVDRLTPTVLSSRDITNFSIGLTFYIQGLIYSLRNQTYNTVNYANLLQVLQQGQNINLTQTSDNKLEVSVSNPDSLPITYNPINYKILNSDLISHLKGIDSELVHVYSEEFILTQDNLNSNSITLFYSSILNSICFVKNGPSLTQNFDYTITNNILNFQNISSLLTVGDELMIIYWFIKN